MHLNEDFITHMSGDKQVMIDTAGNFSGLVRNNKTAAFIVKCLEEETTADKIVDALWEKYDAPKDVIEKDVLSVIEKLRKIGALVE